MPVHSNRSSVASCSPKSDNGQPSGPTVLRPSRQPVRYSEHSIGHRSGVPSDQGERRGGAGSAGPQPGHHNVPATRRERSSADMRPRTNEPRAPLAPTEPVPLQAVRPQGSGQGGPTRAGLTAGANSRPSGPRVPHTLGRTREGDPSRTLHHTASGQRGHEGQEIDQSLRPDRTLSPAPLSSSRRVGQAAHGRRRKVARDSRQFADLSAGFAEMSLGDLASPPAQRSSSKRSRDAQMLVLRPPKYKRPSSDDLWATAAESWSGLDGSRGSDHVSPCTSHHTVSSPHDPEAIADTAQSAVGVRWPRDPQLQSYYMQYIDIDGGRQFGPNATRWQRRSLRMGVVIKSSFQLQARRSSTHRNPASGDFVQDVINRINASLGEHYPRVSNSTNRGRQPVTDRWTLVKTQQRAVSRAPWVDGLELVSPILIAGPNSKWRDCVSRTWKSLMKRYIAGEDTTSHTHFHISVPGGYTLKGLKQVAQCAIVFENALDQLVPEERRSANCADARNLVTRMTLRDGRITSEDTWTLIRKIDGCSTLKEFEDCVQPGYWGSEYIFNLRNVDISHRIEFRKPPLCFTEAQLLAWSEFAVRFVRSAIAIQGLDDLLLIDDTVYSLYDFLHMESYLEADESYRLNPLFTWSDGSLVDLRLDLARPP